MPSKAATRGCSSPSSRTLRTRARRASSAGGAAVSAAAPRPRRELPQRGGARRPPCRRRPRVAATAPRTAASRRRTRRLLSKSPRPAPRAAPRRACAFGQRPGREGRRGRPPPLRRAVRRGGRLRRSAGVAGGPSLSSSSVSALLKRPARPWARRAAAATLVGEGLRGFGLPGGRARSRARRLARFQASPGRVAGGPVVRLASTAARRRCRGSPCAARRERPAFFVVVLPNACPTAVFLVWRAHAGLLASLVTSNEHRFATCGCVASRAPKRSWRTRLCSWGLHTCWLCCPVQYARV